MRVRPLAVVSAVLVVGAATGLDARDLRVAPARWTLVDVSEDTRTVAISYGDSTCAGHLGEPRVSETRHTVRITVPQFEDPPFDDDTTCAPTLIVTRKELRLAAPLGRRKLEQPVRPVSARTGGS